MNIHQKVIRQMKKSHVISKLIICLFFACSSVKQTNSREIQKIFDLEIESYKEFAKNEKIIFDYVSNDYLVNNLNDNSEILNHLSDEDVKYFLDRLENDVNQKYNFDLPKNFHLQSDIVLSIDESFEVKRINISEPIIKNHEIALIAYSFGHKNSMQGGIKIYRRTKGKWKYDKSFNLWIE